jgi:hypothetical protein
VGEFAYGGGKLVHSGKNNMKINTLRMDEFTICGIQ